MLSLTLDVSATSSEDAFVRMSGHIPNKVYAKGTSIETSAALLETFNANQHVHLSFVLPLRKQKSLEKLVQRIHDRSDQKYYGKFLTSEEFMEKFAPTQKDYDKVIAYAKGLGLTVIRKHANRTILNVTGPRKNIEKGFNLRILQYKLENGREFYAPNDNPEVPVSIAKIVNGIVGLDNLATWRSYKHLKQDSETVSKDTAHSFPSGPGGGFAPSDLLVAYNLAGVSANGAGQIVALFELASYQASDINTYTNQFGLPSAKLKNILVDGGSGAGINAEVTLDIELVLALAPQSQIYIYEGPNTDQGVLDTYNRIATDNIAKQVSSSWGLGEDLVTPKFLQAEYAIFLQMAAHGQSIYVAAGDSGAYDNYPNRTLMVDDPASQPYVVGVGGTKLQVDAQTGSYQSETVWNDGLGNGAGGGGVSKRWPIPSWQANIPTVYSKTNRNVPDVSLNSDPNTGYSIYHNGQWEIFGGTSCAAPLWAGFTACVNQQLMSTQQPVLGFANPLLYAIGAGPLSATDFHDVSSGSNLYYPAQANYDNATGWGTFNGADLFSTLTNSTVIPPPPTLKPLLNINMAHASIFKKGQTGTYKITVSNGGSVSTSGIVTVAITLPKGLSYASFSGSGWALKDNKPTFTQKSDVKPGTSFSVLTLNVKVASNAPASFTPTATVSGGGSASSTVTDPTTAK